MILVNRGGGLNEGDYKINAGFDPVPVELSSFTADVVHETRVSLNWETKTEINNYGFEIERKSGSELENWFKLGFVEGHGNSNSPKEYSFLDNNPTGGSKFIYRLKQIDTDGKYEYSYEIMVELIPVRTQIYQNYPNPFNPLTMIKFSLASAKKVRIAIYNSLGEEIAKLVDKVYETGYYVVDFNASNLSSGVYFYRITAGDFTAVKKMLLLK